ncbi:hypothetical protein BH11ARM1_BH11ARM1_02010 [soil metagenome]
MLRRDAMRRFLIFLILVTVPTAALCQVDPLAWCRKTWTTVQQVSSKAASEALKKAPATFKHVPDQVATFAKDLTVKVKSMKLEEREATAKELWRLRGSLNLMALVDPDVLEQVTGIDAAKLRSTQRTINQLIQSLSKIGS